MIPEVQQEDAHPKLSKQTTLMAMLENQNNVLKSISSFGMFDSDIINEIDISQVQSFKNESTHHYKLINHYILDEVSKYDMRPVFTSSVDAEVMDVDISPSNEFIACGLFNGNLEILKTENGQTKFLIKLSKNSFSIPCVKWRQVKDENNITAITADGSISSFNLNDYVQRYKISVPDTQLLSLEYNFHQDHLYTGDNKGNIYMFSEDTQKQVRKFESGNAFSNGHTNRVFALRYLHDNSSLLLSGGWDGMVFLWDNRESKPVRNFIGSKIGGKSLDYKNGKILVGSYESSHALSIFDL